MRASPLSHPLMLAMPLFLFAACHSTQTCSPRSANQFQDCWKTSSCNVGGRNYLITLAGGRVRNTPTWQFKDGENPSILPGKAVAIARRELRGSFGDANNWSIRSITLKSAFRELGQREDLRDKWYYEFIFTPPRPKYPFNIEEAYIIYVLSDGTVVAPEDSHIDDIEHTGEQDAPAGWPP